MFCLILFLPVCNIGWGWHFITVRYTIKGCVCTHTLQKEFHALMDFDVDLLDLRLWQACVWQCPVCPGTV